MKSIVRTFPRCNLVQAHYAASTFSTASSINSFPLIDVHTHMYTPKYMKILQKRSEIPKIVKYQGEDRLVILPDEEKETTTNVGRPIGREYWSVETKLQYMKNHNISKSVISLANPWLDFLTGNAAESVAQELNDELQDICENSNNSLYGFATLPIRNPEASVKEVKRLKSLSKIKGVILGTPGAGNGLDHEGIRDVLAAIAEANYMIFLHPHYGVGNEHYHNSGHALFLALGFPFETTVAVSRLIVSGTLDKIPNLKLLVAHAGAALPSLIGRLDSCVAHDLGMLRMLLSFVFLTIFLVFVPFYALRSLVSAIANRLSHTPSDYLKKMYFDAISYDQTALEGLVKLVGSDRIMFGTDNPFFPPLNVPDIMTAQWPSTVKVSQCISTLSKVEDQKNISYQNAKRLLGI
jgi:aminocarboxymuconate-semialdehyde decarboxylase